MAVRGTTNNSNSAVFLFWNSEGAWKFLLREAEGKWPPGQGGKVQKEGAKTRNKNEE